MCNSIRYGSQTRHWTSTWPSYWRGGSVSQAVGGADMCVRFISSHCCSGHYFHSTLIHATARSGGKKREILPVKTLQRVTLLRLRQEVWRIFVKHRLRKIKFGKHNNNLRRLDRIFKISWTAPLFLYGWCAAPDTEMPRFIAGSLGLDSESTSWDLGVTSLIITRRPPFIAFWKGGGGTIIYTTDSNNDLVIFILFQLMH